MKRKKRSLDNYKSMHDALAKSKGVHEQFVAAETLTAARRILFGDKAKSRRGAAE